MSESQETTPRRLATSTGPPPRAHAVDVTIVLPAYNELSTISSTHDALKAVMDDSGKSWEMLFVDDGSTDGTWTAIAEVAEKDPHVRAVRHRANAGKASALATGFALAQGDIVALADSDMQYEPEDLLRLVRRVEEGFDAVTARKVARKDPLSKRLPSRFFNFFVRHTMHIELHDMNAGLKAMRREAAAELIQFGYGGMHRFFMVILARKGFSVAEVDVKSTPRREGRSKYGAERYVRGALDFLTVFFLSGYVDRPLNLLGGIALPMMGLGSVAVVVAIVLSLAGLHEAMETVLQIGALSIIGGLQLVVLGLIAEMINNLRPHAVLKGEIAAVIRVERRAGYAAPGPLDVLPGPGRVVFDATCEIPECTDETPGGSPTAERESVAGSPAPPR